MSEQRRLSTILFADIADYTALMQSDEANALALLSVFRENLERETSRFDGVIVQYYGDGCLLSFHNTTQAVQCAIALQIGFKDQIQVPVRIGMHLGEVVFKDSNAFGDGVNLASRIESLGIPGAVLLSKAVRDQIRNKADFELVSMGTFDFKNVEEPMEVFALTNPPLVVPKREELKGKTKTPPAESIPWHQRKQTKKIARNLAIYLFGAWLFVEAFAFFVKKKDWDRELINLLIIFAVFGILSTLVFSVFRGRFNWKAVGLQLMAFLMAFFSVFYYILHPTHIHPETLRIVKLTAEKQSPSAALSSLAVLPFTNLMNDKDQDYLVAGMQDGLISEIGRMGGIRIISRTSTLPYTTTAKGMKSIAKELEVDALIEGTLTRIDTMVDLRLRLVDVFPKEKTLWSRSYSTSFDKLLNLYQEVTRNVAVQLNNVLSPEEQNVLSIDSSVDPEAYRAYLKGNYYTGYLTNEGFERAEQYFQQAIEIDDGFAPAYVGLANILMSKKQEFLISPDSANPKIRAFLDQALALNEKSAEVWSGIGAYHITTTYDWQQSEEAFKRSIALNPNDASARNVYAHLLMILNRWPEAWEQMEYAMNIDPKSPWTIAFSGVLYGNSGKMLTAFKKFDQLIEMVPDNPMAIWASLMKHVNTFQHDQAIGDLKRMIAHIGAEDLNPVLDSIYLESDFKTAVRAVAEKLEARSDSVYISPSFMGRLYGRLLQDREKILYYLERSYEVNDPDLGYAGIRRPDNQLQKDPRYVAVMEKIGLW